MLPLLPISIIAIVYMGLGLCGLTPFVALTVSLVQAWRAGRAAVEPLGRRVVLFVALGAPRGAPE